MSPAVAPRRTQVERRADAEAKLVHAAAEIIGESGPAGLTLARVGERAGYSRGLAAHHFGSKAALVERVAEAVAEDFERAIGLDRLPSDDVIGALLALVRAYLGVAADPPVLNRARLVLIADAVAHPDAEARALVVTATRSFRRRLGDRIAAAVAAGELDADPEALAATLIGLLRGITFEAMLDDTPIDGIRREVEQLLTARFGSARA